MTSATTPRYRYREEAPEMVSVPAAELVVRLPEELRGEAGEEVTEERRIDLPCSEILQGNVPRITIGRLAELAGGLVRMPEGRDPSDRINLPPGWIALHFRMLTRREELSPDPPVREMLHPVGGESSSEPGVAFPVIATEGQATSDAKPPKSSSTGEGEVVAIVVEEEKESPAKADKEEIPRGQKSFFSSLPIFRRTVSESKGIPVSPQKEPPVGPTGKELALPSVALERLWKLDPQDELADTSALQALFMTDEKLTLEKVVSKAGELPGLDACVLAHGDRVLCASKTASGIDLQNLSGQAMTMLSQIRESSVKMGLGSVPAVTLHADQGVISFLHNGELCLLVLHADRGFVPGVRERLQEMLGHLSKARPALPPAGGS